jgi:hypothetical protein
MKKYSRAIEEGFDGLQILPDMKAYKKHVISGMHLMSQHIPEKTREAFEDAFKKIDFAVTSHSIGLSLFKIDSATLERERFEGENPITTLILDTDGKEKFGIVKNGDLRTSGIKVKQEMPISDTSFSIVKFYV